MVHWFLFFFLSFWSDYIFLILLVIFSCYDVLVLVPDVLYYRLIVFSLFCWQCFLVTINWFLMFFVLIAIIEALSRHLAVGT
jgi:hypothetical protein